MERNPGHARAFAERLLHGRTRLAVRRRRRQKIRARPVEPLRLFLGRRRVRRVGREGVLTYDCVGNRRESRIVANTNTDERAARVACVTRVAAVTHHHAVRESSLRGGVFRGSRAAARLGVRPRVLLRVRVRRRGAAPVRGGVPPAVRGPRDGRARVPRERRVRVRDRGEGGRRELRARVPVPAIRRSRRRSRRGRRRRGRRLVLRGDVLRPRPLRGGVRQRGVGHAHRVSVHDTRGLGAGHVPGHGQRRGTRRAVLRRARLLRVVLRREPVPRRFEIQIRPARSHCSEPNSPEPATLLAV